MNRLKSLIQRMKPGHTKLYVRARLGRVLLGLSEIGWLKKISLVLVNRFPGTKETLLSYMALSQMREDSEKITQVPQIQPRIAYFDIFKPSDRAWVREISLAKFNKHSDADKELFKGIVLEGHIYGSYSLAVVNKSLFQRLNEDFPDIEYGYVPREGERYTKSINTKELGNAARFFDVAINQELDEISQQRKIRIYHHYPLITDVARENGVPIAIFFWEESQVPADTIESLNTLYDGVLVASWFVKKVLIDNGCTTPIRIINLPLLGNALFETSSAADLKRIKHRQVINLLHVSSCFPRKGVDVLLIAFNSLAQKIPVVRLTIKTFHNPHNNIYQLIENLVDVEHRARINVILDELSSERMASLYHEADIVVLPTRGEGLNMPAIEASQYARPLVVTGFGAHTDYISENESWYVPYQFGYSTSHLSSGLSVWADPSADGLEQNLAGLCMTLLQEENTIQERIVGLKSKLKDRFFSRHSSETVISALGDIVTYRQDKVAKDGIMNICMVTTWNEPCGIAEYSAHIIRRLIKKGDKVNVMAPLDCVKGNGTNQICHWVPSWERGDVMKLDPAEIASDIIWFQHNFGLFPLDQDLLDFVKAQQESGKKLFITLHSSKPVVDFDIAWQDLVSRCLKRFDRVFVHALDDLNTLKRINVVDNVVLMPQGIEAEQQLTNIPQTLRKGDCIRAGCFGFLFPHKGVFQLIEAVSLFVKKHGVESISLRLLTAMHPSGHSQDELERCQKLADDLGVSENIVWLTDYLEMDDVKRQLRQCDLLVLPYQHTQESSSAAVRTALASCQYVATTPTPIFEEVRNATLPIDGYDADAIYACLDEAYSGVDKDKLQKIIQERDVWMENYNWDSIVERYRNLLKAVNVDRHFIDSIT